MLEEIPQAISEMPITLAVMFVIILLLGLGVFVLQILLYKQIAENRKLKHLLSTRNMEEVEDAHDN